MFVTADDLVLLHVLVFLLTYLQHGPEHGAVMRRGAVPPSVPELPLALRDACPRTSPDATHVVLVQLA